MRLSESEAWLAKMTMGVQKVVTGQRPGFSKHIENKSITKLPNLCMNNITCHFVNAWLTHLKPAKIFKGLNTFIFGIVFTFCLKCLK